MSSGGLGVPLWQLVLTKFGKKVAVFAGNTHTPPHDTHTRTDTRHPVLNPTYIIIIEQLKSGADLGWGAGRRTPPPQGFDPLPTQRVPPFDTFSEIHFWPTDPKIFLKAPSAPINAIFEGERAPKKTHFFCQNFSKSAQKRLFWLFFQKKLPAAQKIFAKIRAKQCSLGEREK